MGQVGRMESAESVGEEEVRYVTALGGAGDWYTTFGLRVCKVERDTFM